MCANKTKTGQLKKTRKNVYKNNYKKLVVEKYFVYKNTYIKILYQNIYVKIKKYILFH